MNTRCAVLFTMLLLPAIAVSQTVTFGQGASPEGASRSVVESTDMIMIIQAAGELMEMAEAEKKEYEETVLAFKDGRITERRITFSVASKTVDSPMAPAKKINPPVVDVTYTLALGDEAGGEMMSILREDGQDVSAEERSYLEAEFGDKPKKGFEYMLRGKSVDVGETIILDEEGLKEFKESFATDAMEVNEVTLTLTGVSEHDGEETALFDIVANITGETPIMDMEITMTGNTTILTEKMWPVTVQLNGDIVGVGDHGGTAISADGTMSHKKSATYE